MQCAELADLLSAYADGQTAPAQTECVEAHLDRCPRCRQVVQLHAQVRQLIRLSADDGWTPPDLSLRVVRALQGRQTRTRQWPASFLRIGGSALAVLLTLHLLGAPAPQPGALPLARVQPAMHARATETAQRRPTMDIMPARAVFLQAQLRRLPTAVRIPTPVQSSLASDGGAVTKGGRFSRHNAWALHQLVAV